MGKRENQLQNSILQYLGLFGFDVWRQNQGGMHAEYKGKRRFIRFSHREGVADITGAAPSGKRVEIECKSPKGKPSENQEQFISDMSSLGCIAFFAWSVNDVINHPLIMREIELWKERKRQ